MTTRSKHQAISDLLLSGLKNVSIEPDLSQVKTRKSKPYSYLFETVTDLQNRVNKLEELALYPKIELHIPDNIHGTDG